MRNQKRLPKLMTPVMVLSLLLGACGTASEGEDSSSEMTDVAEVAGSSAVTEATETTEASGATDATTAQAVSGYLGSYVLMDDEYGTMVTVTVEGSTRVIETNSLPDHETGEFPNSGNPNEITEQDFTYEYTTEPVYTGVASQAQTPGVAVNGIAFEPGTGETLTCDDGSVHRIEALQDLYNLGLDFNNAHVQPNGQYHYHGVSQMLVDAYSTGEDLVHVGFAADGHLMYYSKSGAYQSSYQLSTELRTGTNCVPTGPDAETVDIEGTTPDGTYTSDWVYVDGSGDLDQCNGTFIGDEYVYIVTDEYPYIQRCVMGEAANAGPGGGGGRGAPAP